MTEAAGTEPDEVWRIPSWQPAGLILVAATLFALDIYADLSIGALAMTLIIGLASLWGAVCAMRFLMVADDDGIWVRRLSGEKLVEWRDVSDIDVAVGRRNATTLRITRRDKTFVDVPPSLLLPALPTGMRKARARFDGAAIRLGQLAQLRAGD